MTRLERIQAEGACRDKPHEWFFPDRSHGPNGSEQAKAVCEGCPLRAECLEHALTEPEEYGVWGGTTPADRKKMR